MPELPAIIATNPTILPATEEKIYDRWWITYFLLSAPDPNAPITVICKVRKMRVLADGTKEFSTESEVSLRLDDFLSLAIGMAAQGNTALLDAGVALINGVIAYGQSVGVL